MPESPSKTTAPSAPSRRDPAERELLDRLGIAGGAHHDGRPNRRARVIEAIKTLLWVAPLTALIWIYAEREQLATRTDVQVNIELKSNAGDRIVTLLSPQDHRLELDLAGPRGSLDTVRDALADPKYNPLQVYMNQDVPVPFEGDIAIASLVGRTDLFTSEAVTVTRSRPASVRVRVEKKATITVPVRIKEQYRIAGDVTFQPDRIQVEAPESEIARLRPDQRVAYADITALLDRPVGTHTLDVEVTMDALKDPILSRRTVRAIADIKPWGPTVLSSIPLRYTFGGLVVNEDKYRFQVDETLTNVTVTGPPSAIRQLQSMLQDPRPTFTPMAVVEIEPRDLENITDETKITLRLKAGNYRMPPDVTVTNPDREVIVTVTPR